MNTTEAAAKKDTQRLQRAIVDGLEDVKAQDITVFNTEHLSPLFERVIVASGTSNRQTKALASSIVDAVRKAGFPKPRVEGQENGEWIIVDCGAAVAHIMQPAIRQYYHLEEIWGEKPVRLRLGAPQPAQPAPKAPAKKTPETTSLRRSTAVKTVQRAETAARQAAKKAAQNDAKKAAAKKGGASKGGAPKSSAPKSSAPKSAAPKSSAPKAPAKKSVAVKSVPVKKSPTAAKKAPAKKSS